MFFFGTSNVNLDEKNRLTLPARYRDKLGKVVYVTKGFDHCLSLYTEEGFIKLTEKFQSLDELNPEERQYQRTFFSSSNEYEIDKAGRITLTKDHLQRAGISKEIIIIGNKDHIEIWDRNRYLDMDKIQDENFEENARLIAAARKRID